MKKLFLFLLSLYLCSMSVPILAQDAELVPAMVMQMADGSKQVVQLDYTSVTDFSVLCSKGSLAVSVPEADVNGVHSINFAMVKQNEITNSLEEVPFESSFAGYKDLFIQRFRRPGYTIEVGEGENPLPLEQFDQIYRDNVGILTTAALGLPEENGER